MSTPRADRSSYADYIAMQKRAYEADVPSGDIVGCFEWHENFPYETQLLFVNGDLRLPILDHLEERTALDFGCGPGRMVGRMRRLFAQVDGVDISSRLIEEARANYPESRFWVTSGDDLGGVAPESYDLIYSTIAMQHIAVRSIRSAILRKMSEALKPGGAVSIQLAFNPRYPYLRTSLTVDDGTHLVEIRERDAEHARWAEDRVAADETNSGCDAAIGTADLPVVEADFAEHFGGVRYWFYDVSIVYDNLLGARHDAGYWPTHWLFVSGYRD
jgi:SAM-dependent methyltransferase